jgi:hypothetical protein
MRLIEFTDPKPYILSAHDAADFLKQLERIWPPEGVAFVLGTKSQPPVKQTKLFDALYERVSKANALGVMSAAYIVAFAIAQGSGRFCKLIPPNFLLTI